MKQVYMNCAATSAQKPNSVIKSMQEYLGQGFLQSSDRDNRTLMEQERTIFGAREVIAKFFNVSRPEQVIFTSNATQSINMVLHGMLHAGDHVLTTMIEHNAVARPLHLLEKRGLEVSYLPCTNEGEFNPSCIVSAIKKNTKALVMSHASNVVGTILPIHQAAKIAKELGLLVVIDCAQTAGSIEIDFGNSDFDVLIFTGHKGLMGPTGMGGFLVKDDAVDQIDICLTGGTGSLSRSLDQPMFLPDRFEAGTPNMLGIVGLTSAVEFIQNLGISTINKHESELHRMLLEGLLPMKGIRVYGPRKIEKKVAIVSIGFDELDVSIAGQILFEDYGIIARAGLHCAPLAHQSIGTIETGTLRLSPGYFSTTEEIEYLLQSIADLLKRI